MKHKTLTLRSISVQVPAQSDIGPVQRASRRPPHLEAVQEVVGEDEPVAPDAQQPQDVPPQRLLMHPRLSAAVRVLPDARASSDWVS